jgi:hypothetical protein
MVEQMVRIKFCKALHSFRLEIENELKKENPLFRFVAMYMRRILAKLKWVFLKHAVSSAEETVFSEYVIYVFAPWLYDLHRRVRSRFQLTFSPEHPPPLYTLIMLTYHYDVARMADLMK